MKHIFIFLLLTLLIVSCGRVNDRGQNGNAETTYQEYVIECFCENGKINCADIDRIRMAYIPKGFTTQFGLARCSEVLGFNHVRDTVFVNRNFICRFINLVNRLEVADNDYYCCDLRVTILIIPKYEKPRIALCLGEGWGILFEGQVMEHCQDLFDFIDDTLYPGYRVFREAFNNREPNWKELWDKFLDNHFTEEMFRNQYWTITDFSDWWYRRED